MQDETGNSPPSGGEILRMTSEIVASFVANNAVTAETLPDVIRSVYKTVSSLSGAPEPRAEDRPKPAVPISKSVGDDYIVCLEDGKKLKMLKRYLRSRFNMSPDDVLSPLGPTGRLSDGGAGLYRAALRIRQEDRAGQGRAEGEVGGERSGDPAALSI